MGNKYATNYTDSQTEICLRIHLLTESFKTFTLASFGVFIKITEE